MKADWRDSFVTQNIGMATQMSRAVSQVLAFHKLAQQMICCRLYATGLASSEPSLTLLWPLIKQTLKEKAGWNVLRLHTTPLQLNTHCYCNPASPGRYESEEAEIKSSPNLWSIALSCSVHLLCLYKYISGVPPRKLDCHNLLAKLSLLGSFLL